ncbi:MAG: hypothetical protein IJT73_11460 [Selenomonadaceae bacterium]|nr:hypothetical protein [Selenomonadaceae bacterium]
MELPKTGLVKKICISRSQIVSGNAQEFIARAQESMKDFSNCVKKICALLDGRFINFQQDFWYDSLTNLLLPKFDKNFCKLLTLEEFSNIDEFMNFNLAGFKPRSITSEECKEIFFGTTNHYPHAPGKRQPLFFIGGQKIVGSYIYTPLSRTPKIFEGKFSVRNLFFVAARKNCFCREDTGELLEIVGSNIKNCGSNPSKTAIFIPVCNLPLNDKIQDKKISAACAIIEAGLIPENWNGENISELSLQYRHMKNYLSYDGANWNLDIENWKQAAQKNEQLQENIGTGALKKFFLECDTRRANLTPYPERFLTDPESGHWELYEERNFPAEDSITLPLSEIWYERNPKLDVKASGVCAIDFGTKSTVAVCLDDGKKLLRIGKGNLLKKPSPQDYENPTVIELRDYQAFLFAYHLKDGRPFTEWENLTVSHEALNRLLDAEEQEVAQSIFSELKQWANRKHGVLRLRDRCGKDIWLNPYSAMERSDFDPIEIYAYYLGLYINNMYNGIFLEYIFSFPVKYENSVRKNILESFKRGLLKSLPESVLNDKDLMKNFTVYAGACEPAAYASCALRELEKIGEIPRPKENEPIHFAVFDFGGGTTDFDFGIWRLPTAEDRGDFNYVIEHFDAESDSNLGGEKLLNLIAYKVYQNNLDLMRENEIPFSLPENCKPFDGAEFLLTDSLAANLNRRRLSDKLRPIWEEWQDFESMDDEPLTITFFKEQGKKNLDINISVEELREILRKRISRGVENFFCALNQAFVNLPLRTCHILLAGNSCKSPLLQNIFQTEIEKYRQIFCDEILRRTGRAVDAVNFSLHMPLGRNENAQSYERIATGKSGVAFGLLDSRRGGNDILIIDKNIADDETKFYFHLGTSDPQSNFKILIRRDENDGSWKKFLYVTENIFDIYFTNEPRADGGKVPVEETSRITCRIDFLKNFSEGRVFIRKISTNKIEYVVCNGDNLSNQNIVSKVANVELNS